MKQSSSTVMEQNVKTPAARLLDLLCGWAEFVDAHQEAEDPEVSTEEIFALYQEAGAQLLELDDDDLIAEQKAVLAFIVGRIIPVLLRADAAGRKAAA